MDELQEYKGIEKKLGMKIPDFIKCITHYDDDLYMIKDGEIIKVIKNDLEHNHALVLQDGVVVGDYFYFSVSDRFGNEYELKFCDYRKNYFFTCVEALPKLYEENKKVLYEN